MADGCKYILILIIPSFDFLIFSDEMDVDPDVHPNPDGKILLYTSRDINAQPHMAIKHKTTAYLPSILKDLALKYSPIRSM